jgi:hypothetical protein
VDGYTANPRTYGRHGHLSYTALPPSRPSVAHRTASHHRSPNGDSNGDPDKHPDRHPNADPHGDPNTTSTTTTTTNIISVIDCAPPHLLHPPGYPPGVYPAPCYARYAEGGGDWMCVSSQLPLGERERCRTSGGDFACFASFHGLTTGWAELGWWGVWELRGDKPVERT